MSVQDLYGNLLVRSQVEANGTATATVACGASGCNHAIEIENLSTLPYDVEVEAVIAGSSGALSFISAGTVAHSWKGAVHSLAADELEFLHQSLRCHNSPGQSRIHCVRVDWKKAGRHRWRRATGNYPLALTVAVK